MKTVFTSMCLTGGILSLASVSAQADHHMEMAMQFAPSELMTCSMNEGKDRDDFEELTDAFTKWIRKNDPDYTYYVLTPTFYEGDPEWDFGIIGSWTSGSGMGKGYDAWIKDDDDVGEIFNDVADCGSSLASVTTISAPDGSGPWEKGVVWFSRCEYEDDAGLPEAIAAHKTMSKAMSEMGETSVSWAFLPALGFGDPEYDYYHVQAWPSFAALGSGFDSFFNKGGWKVQADAQEDVVECASPNLYAFRLMHAAED